MQFSAYSSVCTQEIEAGGITLPFGEIMLPLGLGKDMLPLLKINSCCADCLGINRRLQTFIVRFISQSR